MAGSTAVRQEEWLVSLQEAGEVLSPQRRSLVARILEQLERDLAEKSLLSKRIHDSLSSLRTVCAEMERQSDESALERTRYVVSSVQSMFAIAELRGALCSLHGDEVGARRHRRMALQHEELLAQARKADTESAELRLFARIEGAETLVPHA